VRNSRFVAPPNGHAGTPGAFLTREVRWFREGPVPTEVVDWFARAAEVEREHRQDRYDLDAARHGLGVKQRNMGTVDSKRRLWQAESVKLAAGLTGNVEDWLKITPAVIEVERLLDDTHVEVHKDIYTRRYRLDGAAETGCEAELASIRMNQVRAWSLCFETFGAAGRREEALQSGVLRFLEESPLLSGMSFDASTSLAYPAWITRTCLEPA
jgi:hypothetical protein